MKTGFLVIALTVGLLTATIAGNAQAGDRSANGADPEAVLNSAWMVEGPIETGMLPGTSGEGIVSGGVEFPLEDIGGVLYRSGLDTGP